MAASGYSNHASNCLFSLTGIVLRFFSALLHFLEIRLEIGLNLPCSVLPLFALLRVLLVDFLLNRLNVLGIRHNCS